MKLDTIITVGLVVMLAITIWSVTTGNNLTVV